MVLGHAPLGLSVAFTSNRLSCAPRLPWGLSGKESTCQWRRHRFVPWVGKVPWRRKWQSTPSIQESKCSCLGNSMDIGAWWATVHGVAKMSDMTKQLNNDKLSQTHWNLALSASDPSEARQAVKENLDITSGTLQVSKRNPGGLLVKIKSHPLIKKK